MLNKFLIILLVITGGYSDLSPVFDGKGTYLEWEKNDEIPFAINEFVDFRVVIDDGNLKDDSLNKIRDFRLEGSGSYMLGEKRITYLNHPEFKKIATIGQNPNIKYFVQRMITVKSMLDSFTIKAVPVGLSTTDKFVNEGEMKIDMKAKNFYKTIVDKKWIDSIYEYHAASLINLKNNWYNQKNFGTLRFRISGNNPSVKVCDIEKFILTVNDHPTILEMDSNNNKWLGDEHTDLNGFVIHGIDDGISYPEILITRNSDLFFELKNLTAEFQLKAKFLTNPDVKNKKLEPALKRNLLMKIPKDKSPKMLFIAIFSFVFGLIIIYFLFVYYIGDIGPRSCMYPDLEDYEFSTFRRIIFPIYPSELTKILPLCFLMVCTVFVYSAYRDIKDAMVTGSGAEEGLTQGNIMTNWLKVVGVLPGSLLCSAVLLSLTNRYRFPIVFYFVCVFFGIYFVVNAWILYPLRKTFTVKFILNRMLKIQGDNFFSQLELGILGIFAFPVTSVHYIMSELWGTVTLSFLSWGYINLITKKKDACRSYPMVALLAQIGQTLAGTSVSSLCSAAKKTKNIAMSLKYLNIITAFLTSLFGLTIVWMDNYVLEINRFKIQEQKLKRKKSVGLLEGLKSALTDGHIFCLTGIVFSYGAVVVVLELTYKDSYSSQFLWDASEMSTWKGGETTYTGILTFICMLFVGSNMLNYFGWLFTALFTPLITTLFSFIFYISAIQISIAKLGLLFLPDNGKLDIKVAGTQSIGAWMVCYVGLTMIVFIKSFKYATLDPTKEMAYLPLSSGEKNQAKAVVDIVGARAGKSAGSFFNILFVSQFGGNAVSRKGMLWCSFLFSIILLNVWSISVKFLDKHIKNREFKNSQKLNKNLENIEITKTNGISSDIVIL